EPGEGAGVQVKNRVAVASHLGGVGLAVKHAEGAALALCGFDLEFAGREGEQVGGKGRSFGKMDALAGARGSGPIGHDLPVRRNFEGQSITRLETRLIEAGEGEVRAGRHEQGVKEIGVAVESLVTGGEINRKGVFAGFAG